MYKKIGLIAICLILVGAGCSDNKNQATEKESKRVAQQQQVYVDSQPIPTFDWSLERHILIELYQARNEAVTTYSYVRNWQGDIIFSCKSIGYPIPANTQLTNPERRIGDGLDGEIDTIPQPEPNGTFTSPSTVGTYVFCLNDDGTISPSVFEQEVETHLSPLNKKGNSLKGEPELKIKANK